MNKTEYMDALKSVLQGLPAHVIEKTLWEYEAKFVDGKLAGKTEESIAEDLPKPVLVAAQKKAALRYETVKRHVSLSNIASLMVALIGLAVFNLFMIIPAIVYFSLLISSYALAIALYAGGIAITAAGVSGVQQFHFNLPSHYSHSVSDDGRRIQNFHGDQVQVDISEKGILINGEPETATPVAPLAKQHSSVHVNIDSHLQGIGIWHGIGMLLGSILLMMFSMFMTKYTYIGFKNYLNWNIAQVRLSQHA